VQYYSVLCGKCGNKSSYNDGYDRSYFYVPGDPSWNPDTATTPYACADCDTFLADAVMKNAEESEKKLSGSSAAAVAKP
jgi:hypothetical protein